MKNVEAGVVFETMLLEPMLEPLSAGAGAFGSYGAELVAQTIAERDRDGFAAALAAQLEGRP